MYISLASVFSWPTSFLQKSICRVSSEKNILNSSVEWSHMESCGVEKLDILELVARLVYKYGLGLGEKNVHCLFTHSCLLQLLQLLLFATTIYLSKMIDPSKKHAH